MLKKTIPLVLATFIFAGCSLKMPSFSMPSFLQFEDKNLASLEEANICQKIESLDSKLTCYKKLLETNNSYAQLRMGTYHADRKEYKDAIKYLNLSKENDNLYSNLALAFLYYKGDGVEKNIDKSFELLEESSHVDPNAAYQLARFYLQGINTKVDHQKGVELVEFAAQKGVLTAQKMLVNINKQGLFSQPKDQKKVDYWEAKIKENKEDLTFKVYKI
jgi:TPR repeat protein